jgi:hypothetical protein
VQQRRSRLEDGECSYIYFRFVGAFAGGSVWGGGGICIGSGALSSSRANSAPTAGQVSFFCVNA